MHIGDNKIHDVARCKHVTSLAKTQITCSAAQGTQSDLHGLFPSSDRQTPS